MTDLRIVTALVAKMLESSANPAQIEAAAELKEIVGFVLAELEEKNKKILELEGSRQAYDNTIIIGDTTRAEDITKMLEDRGINPIRIIEMPEVGDIEYKLAPIMEFPKTENIKEKKPWSKDHKKSGSKFF